MLLFTGECTFFVKKSKLETFKWNTGNIPHSKTSLSIGGFDSHRVQALKDSPEISRELCAKAKELAKEMNYRPNPFAMSLRKNAPRIIGVVVPDIVTHFFASILNGIENMAIANGYFVIITTSHESYEHEKRNIENLVNMRVEGIIACLSQETTDYSHFAALKDINMPLILFDRVCLTESLFVGGGGRGAIRTDGDTASSGQRQQAGGLYRRSQPSGHCKKKKTRLSGGPAREPDTY